MLAKCIFVCKQTFCNSNLSRNLHANRDRLAMKPGSIVHLHLTFEGLMYILSLRGRQEHCPFTTRLRVLKIVSERFQGMTKGMPIVQDVAQPSISLVTLNDIHLQPDAASNDLSEQCWVTSMQKRSMHFKRLKQVSIKNHTVFYYLCPSFAV